MTSSGISRSWPDGRIEPVSCCLIGLHIVIAIELETICY